MQFCVTRVILRDLAALVPQIFHSLHKITLNSYLLSCQMSFKFCQNYLNVFVTVFLRLDESITSLKLKYFQNGPLIMISHHNIILKVFNC
jgi:hypothetical protein